MASNSITGLGIHPVWRVPWQEGWPYDFKGCSVNGNEEIFLGKQPIPRVHPTHQTVRQLWNEFLFCLVVKRPHRCFSNKVFNKKLKHFDSFPKNQEFLQYPVIAGTSLRKETISIGSPCPPFPKNLCRWSHQSYQSYLLGSWSRCVVPSRILKTEPGKELWDFF